jgi:hypothetical protein
VFECVEGYGAIHRSGVDKYISESLCDTLCKSALAARRKPSSAMMIFLVVCSIWDS